MNYIVFVNAFYMRPKCIEGLKAMTRYVKQNKHYFVQFEQYEVTLVGRILI